VAAGLLRIGFEIASQEIWDKGLFAMSRGWFHWGHEPCWVVRKPGIPNLFLGSRDQSTVWRAPSSKMIMGGSDEEKFDHPAQKPVVLSEILIRNHLRAGEVVYDPFLGSGTTLVAAETLGRRCHGLEIDPRYAQVTIERWQGLTGRAAERPMRSRSAPPGRAPGQSLQVFGMNVSGMRPAWSAWTSSPTPPVVRAPSEAKAPKSAPACARAETSWPTHPWWFGLAAETGATAPIASAPARANARLILFISLSPLSCPDLLRCTPLGLACRFPKSVSPYGFDAPTRWPHAAGV
jgi:DNA methylase